MKFGGLALATLLLVAGAPAAAGQGASAGAGQEPPASPREGTTLSEAELDRRTAEVADRLRCPVCRNQSVLESSSELARSMQGVIREKLAAGQSPEEIEAFFVQSYGEWILLRPEPEGMNLLVYVLPGLALLLGGVAVGWRIRRWSRGEARARPSESPPADFDEEEERWLRTALRER